MIPLYVCLLSIGLTVSICFNLFLLYENSRTSDELDQAEQDLFEVASEKQEILNAINDQLIKQVQEENKTDLM